MSLIVQKFGGSSVADPEKIKNAARKAIRAAQAGNQVVVVVSAMGKTTDHLISLAQAITDHPSDREMDMLMSSGEQVTIALLAIALESFGYKAVSMTGAQIGIQTDNSYMKARIKHINTDRLKAALDSGKIVIAAGFQGVDEDGNITTLGRGGSDTSAVALAAALDADECEIYTDVDGVYTTDPRIIAEARKVKQISYDEMLELASLGAGVMHSRSIEFAKKFGVNVQVRSSFSDIPGSRITLEPESGESVAGCALAKSEARLTLVGIPDRPGNAMKIFAKIAQAKVATDMIVQNVGLDNKTDLSFTVPAADLAATLEVLEASIKEIGAERVDYEENVAKVSAVGLGMKNRSGVAQQMFQAISEKDINISMITTSEIKISALVSYQDAPETLRAVHNVFALSEEPAVKVTKESAAESSSANPQEEFRNIDLSRLSGMEEILIEGIYLDRSQARVTMGGIPDSPGIASTLFKTIADAGVVVDMIVQSCGKAGRAVISFTVPRNVLDKTLTVAKKLAKEWNSDEPVCNPTVAILSVRGTGLRSHTGLAYRIFKTIADGGINVNIICTSERNIAITVDDKNGTVGLELLKSEFAKDMM